MMAEPLKNSFGPDVVSTIAASLASVQPSFDEAGFARACLDGYAGLELTARARHISDALSTHLPADRAAAMKVLLSSLSSLAELNHDLREHNPMSGFVYLPYVFFVADHGSEEFDLAMELQYELTQLFTAEFSIRAYLVDHRDATLERLRVWAHDSSEHVRRLVSEGTRPRLPWAPRLKEFQRDPGPVIALLELLKDDPAEYVRRSVANNLNDIAKDHPDVVVAVARRWWSDGDDHRRRLIRHGLRTLIKKGHPGALDVLGYGLDSPAVVRGSAISPDELKIGERVRLEVDVHNPTDAEAAALVDFRIHFVKANGSTSVKVFKGGEVVLGAGDSKTIKKSVSVAQHSTRTHYPGVHLVEVSVNGRSHELGSFRLFQ